MMKVGKGNASIMHNPVRPPTCQATWVPRYLAARTPACGVTNRGKARG